MKTVSRERVGRLRYRRQFLDEDRRQMTLVIILSTLVLALSVRNDFVLLRDLPAFYLLITIRSGHLLLTLVSVILLREKPSIRRLEQAGALWNLGTVGLMVAVGITRISTHELQGPLLAVIVALCIFYFAQRGMLWSRIMASFAISGLLISRLLSAHATLSSSARTTGILLLILLNIIGIATAHSFEQQRRKRYEAERQERRARLELTAKNRDLAAQKERAEALSRSRTAFLATMSHEFRTPMNAVIGLSDLLASAPLAPEYHEHACTIRDSATSLLSLLNDILDFTKIDAGKLALSPAPFDLHALLASILNMMRPAAIASEIELSSQISPQVPVLVMGDDLRLRQVLVNLLSNAVKFTSKGFVRFVVTAQALGNAIYEIGFTIEDSGTGMSPEVMERLFLPFEQGDGGITRRYGGTGLGLAISKQIIIAMGGDIHVESQEGKGSKFSFSVRLSESEARERSSIPSGQRLLRNPRPLAILVVDDLSLNRTVARVVLERLGYVADFANDGHEAIEAATKSNYDVILMDLRMPGMGGIEATKCITERLTGKRMPQIIAMSASAFEEDRAACRAVGMRDFITKPIDMERLGSVLDRVARASVPSSPDLSVAPALDLAPLEQLRLLEAAGEAGFVASLCREFLNDTPVRIQRMKEALTRGDSKELEREAHSLKSASASLGAMDMSKLCATIESATREKKLEGIEKLLEQLSREMPRVEAGLRREGLA